MQAPEIAELIRRYQEGESVHSLGAALGLSGATIAQRLRRAGVILRTKGAPQKQPEERACKICEAIKPLDEFEADKRLACGKGHRCKACSSLRASKARHRKYGLTDAEFSELLERTGGHCQICGVHGGNSIHIDHCHQSGRVRGLLCRSCNLALGLLRDRPELLEKMRDYLER